MVANTPAYFTAYSWNWCLQELKSHKIFLLMVRAIKSSRDRSSGGPNSVYEEGSFDIDPEIFESRYSNSWNLLRDAIIDP